MKKTALLLMFFALFCSGCYRMPEEGEVSVVPITNNPAVTGQGREWTPGIEC